MKSCVFLFPSILSTILIMAVSCSPKEKTTAMDDLTRLSYISSVDGLERDFFLYLPKGYHESDKKWPVLMFLHGDGERGNGKDELDYVMIHGPLLEAWVMKRDLPFIMIVPQLHMFGRDTLMPYLKDRNKDRIPKRLADGIPDREAEGEPTEPMMGAVPDTTFSADSYGPPNGWEKCEADLLHMLDTVLNNYAVDKDRVYLTGLSYGGFGTWYMAGKHPERFAAICPVVGWGHPALMEPIAKAKLPVWVFAGGRDGAVLAKDFYEGVNTLESLGHHNVRFTIHEDMGHDVWKRVYGGDDVYNWLLSSSMGNKN